LPLRDYIDLTLNDPESSTEALAIGSVILALIVFSTITFCLETLPWFHKSNPGYDRFFTFEAICIALFTVEFTTRFVVTRNRREFASSALNQIDFIAILPFYLELIAKGMVIPGLSVLRVTRLARVFRLLKVSKDSLYLLGETMSRSARLLNILGFLLAISLVMFSTMMYYAERGTYDTIQGKWFRTIGFTCDYVCSPESRKLTTPYLECAFDGEARSMFIQKFTVGPFPDLCERVSEHSPFQSIVHSLWWAVVTAATVGYGDMYPRSLVGYMLAGLSQLSGILVIALPITVIGSNFSAIYEGMMTHTLKGADPTKAVVAGRLHASGQGSTHAPITQNWLTVLTQAWDIDVCYKELLPCKPCVPRRKLLSFNHALAQGQMDLAAVAVVAAASHWTTYASSAHDIQSVASRWMEDASSACDSQSAAAMASHWTAAASVVPRSQSVAAVVKRRASTRQRRESLDAITPHEKQVPPLLLLPLSGPGTLRAVSMTDKVPTLSPRVNSAGNRGSWKVYGKFDGCVPDADAETQKLDALIDIATRLVSESVGNVGI